MDKAGLKPDDRVLQIEGTGGFYKFLINSLGKEAVFIVLRDKKEVKIKVKVPEMELPLRSVTFLFLKRENNCSNPK